MLNGCVFHFRFYATGTTLSGLKKIVAAESQGSRNGNLGLKDGTALRLWWQIRATNFNSPLTAQQNSLLNRVRRV